MDVQRRIRRLMESRGWSEYRLAKEAGLSQSTISNLFRRNNAPGISTLETICGAFGITMAQFFSEGGEAVVLTEEQRAMLFQWATLTEEQRKKLYEFVQTIVESAS